MKQALLSLFIAAGFLQHTKAQTFEYLDANNIKARTDTSGLLFKNPATGDPGFEAPRGSGLYTLNGCHILVGGKTTSSVLKFAGSDLLLLNDYRPGPLQSGGTAVPVPGPGFNRLWKISKADIDYHIANYTTSGYIPAAIIAEWPAYGNPMYSAAMGDCAPFFDYNGNNIYDPANGDYPLIRGTQAIFQVFNDNASAHETMSQPIGIEISLMLYAFDCTDDSTLANTVFAHYEIINRGTQTLFDTYVGLNVNTDIANPNDDYIGSDPTRSLFYGYNADGFGETATGGTGYDTLLPMQGIVFLNGPYQDADGIDNPINSSYSTAVAQDGISYAGLGNGYNDVTIDNETMGLRKFLYYSESAPNAAMYAPHNGDEMYNYLSGLYLDDTQPVSGGYGFPGLPGSGSTPVDYSFYGYDDVSYWATRGVTTPGWDESANVPADRSGIGSAGPFTLDPGAYNSLDVAFIFARDYTSAHNPMTKLKLYSDAAHAMFLSGTTPCGSFTYNNVDGITENAVSFSLYPNPVSQVLSLTIKTPDKNNIFSIHDVTGKLIQSGTINDNTTSIDVSSFENGIYLITLNHTGTQKFVVQH